MIPDIEELDFNDERYGTDDVPVFDRGKTRDMGTDPSTYIEGPGKDTTLRTCPICSTEVDLRKTEIGTIDEWGECVFFCSTDCKSAWRGGTRHPES